MEAARSSGGDWKQSKISRRAENDGLNLPDAFQANELRAEFGFLFRRFRLGNLFAKRAGMLAAERAIDRFGERPGLKIVRQHSGPGDRLQHKPMRAGCRKNGNDQQRVTQDSAHERLSRFAAGVSMVRNA